MGTAPFEQFRVVGRIVQARFVDARSRALLLKYLQILVRPDKFEGPGISRVLDTPYRATWRVRLEGEVFYVKHYEAMSIRGKLSDWLRCSAADRETHASRIMVGLRLPAVEVVAHGRAQSTVWTVSRAIVPSSAADAWREKFPELITQPERLRQVLIKLARVLGRMHSAGLVHRDLHLGNLLLIERDGRYLPVIKGLELVSHHSKPGRRRFAKSLAALMCDAWGVTTRTQRLAFLRQYLRASGFSGSLRGWAVLVEYFAQRQRQTQIRKLDRSIRGKNAFYTRVRARGGWRGQAVLAPRRRFRPTAASSLTFTQQAWKEALSEPAALVEYADKTIESADPSTRIVRRGLTVGEHIVDVHIKRYTPTGFRQRLASLLGLSPSVRAFRKAHALLSRGIATPLPLAALERRAGPWLRESLLITETVTPSDNLNGFLHRWLIGHAPTRTDLDIGAQRRIAQDILRQLGRMLLHLHEQGFVHRTLRAKDLTVHWTNKVPPQVMLVDVEGVRYVGRLNRKQIFHGLVQMNLSLLECPAVNHAGRLRMLLSYLSRPGSGRIHYKPYWREIERRSAQELKGRPKLPQRADRPSAGAVGMREARRARTG